MISNLFVGQVIVNYLPVEAEIMEAILDGQGMRATRNKCNIKIITVTLPARRGPRAGRQRGNYNQRARESVRQ